MTSTQYLVFGYEEEEVSPSQTRKGMLQPR